MDNVVISIKGLTKQVKDNIILDNINIDIARGKIVGFIGRNGSGKTMLFKTICGLANPSSGQIFVFGKKIEHGSFPVNFGAIIENPGFIPNYTAFANLKMLASIKNIISDEEIKKSIEKVGLDPNEKKKVGKYSLGMKQRLGIAQAIMEKPELLILDEPMNGLDKDGVVLIRNLLLELRETGVTILISSHNSEDIKVLCDKVFELDRGKLLL
jgi:ABC-2 type transport system ATP-binding protein